MPHTLTLADAAQTPDGQAANARSRRGGSTAIAWVLLTLALASTAQAAEKLPADVRNFIDRRAACDHFRGEPWDMGEQADVKQRREFVFAKVKQLCRGTDRHLGALRRKYQDQPAIAKALHDFETVVETQ